MSDSNTQVNAGTVPAFDMALLKPGYWLSWLALLCFYCFSWLPAKALDSAANRLSRYMLKKNKKRYRIAYKNLSLCFPNKTEDEIIGMVYAHFRAQARAMLQYALLWWHPEKRLRDNIDIEGFDQIEKARADGKNVIILLCHSASIDVAIVALSMRLDTSCSYNSIKSPLLNWLVAKGRVRFGTQVYTREDGLRPLVKSLKDGQVLLYPCDGDLGAERCVFAPFYGVQKATVPVLGRLAKKTDSIVFTCISVYDKQQSRYIVNILPPVQGLSGEDDDADSLVMNKAIEQAVNLSPMEYLWTLTMFKTRPDGEVSLYR